jgi:hypothetical protein
MRHSFPVRRSLFNHDVKPAAPLARGAGAGTVTEDGDTVDEMRSRHNKSILALGLGSLVAGAVIGAGFIATVHESTYEDGGDVSGAIGGTAMIAAVPLIVAGTGMWAAHKNFDAAAVV